MNKTQTSKASIEKSQQGRSVAKKSKPTVLIVFVILLFILVSAGVVVFMLNIGNFRDSVLAVVSPETAIEEEISEQESLEAQIRDEIIRLNEKEDELNTRDSQLNLRETELNAREEELNVKIQETLALEQRLSPQVESVLRISEMYKNMESEQAALILSEMENTEQIILVLKNMDEETSGEIIGLMEPEIAARLIERMMPQE